MEKLKVVQGNAAEDDLGLSKVDWKLLTENVHIIYHMAASIRFDDSLQYAIFVNVRSTKAIIELAYETKNLVLFLYVSTAYCNLDKHVLEEKLYPPRGNWRETIEIAENADNRTLDVLSHKYIGDLQNTYIFTKSMAEAVTMDLCPGKIPAVIIRPSIVVGMAYDPLPGWTDNLNGPAGLCVAIIKGVLRTILGRKDAPQDMVPVDAVVANIMVATYKHGLNNISNHELEVYNSSSPLLKPYTLRDTVKAVIWKQDKIISEKMLWYPRATVTNCSFNYYLQVVLFHLIPAVFLDVLFKAHGKRPIFVKMQRKIFLSNTVLAHFMRTAWEFRNEKLKDLEAAIPEEDRNEYCIHEKVRNLDHEATNNLHEVITLGMLKHVFKEDAGPKNLPMLNRLWLLDVAVKTILVVAVVWQLFVKLNVLGKLLCTVVNYIESI